MVGYLGVKSTPDHTAMAILRFLQDIGPQVREWSHSAIPAILAACEHYSFHTRNMASSTLLSIASSIYIGSHLSRIIPVLVSLTKQSETSTQATKTLCGLVKECGLDALHFAMTYESQLGIIIAEHPYYLEYAEGSAGEEVDK